MLEWYVAKFDYYQLMDQCEEMLINVFKDIGHTQDIVWQNKTINFASPWEKITVAEAFTKYAPISCQEALDREKFDEILTQYIEPSLGNDRPTFLYDYPAKLAALSRIKNIDPTVAERFELYIGGLEMANGFSELTDAREQRQRFVDASEIRALKKWARYPMPDKFLNSLETLPPCAGIALGIDRLAMILTNKATIDEVVAFTPEDL
jgi:lysyl-tRNA synthetase class 2